MSNDPIKLRPVRDDLVSVLRFNGDHATFMPHLHHKAADRIEAQSAEITRLRAELAKAEARGYRRALEDAAVACEVEADKCDDAAKWGESRQYVADCKAASYAMRDRAYAIRKMGEKG